MTRHFGSEHQPYVPVDFNNFVGYSWDRYDRQKTGASFKILSEAHAQVMIALHPYLAPAIKKQKNRAKGYGDWFLVGVTQDSTKYEIFKALLLVNGKKDT